MTFENKDYITLGALFLISFYVWSLPMQTSPLPYGEADASHQFAHAEYYAMKGAATREFPWYLATWYEWMNKKDFYGPINAPPYFVNIALMQVLSGDRFYGTFLYYAVIGNFVVVLSVYFLMRKLYGHIPAAVSGFLVIFTFQNGLSYLWGQRTILLALSFMPLVLYTYYKYTESFIEKKERKIYFYCMAAFLGIGSFIHPAMPFASASILTVYTLCLLIKYKKLPFNLITVGIGIVIFFILVSPFVMDYKSQEQSGLFFKPRSLSTLLYLYQHSSPDDTPMLYSYKSSLGGYWTIPFLIMGILSLAYRRNNNDLLMLSWFLGLYLILHLDIIGINAHEDRLVKGWNHVIFPLVVLGALSLSSFIPQQKRASAKYVIVCVVAVLALMFNAQEMYSLMKNAYPPIMRVTPAQLQAADWISHNLPEYSVIYGIGSVTDPKLRWLYVLSHRTMLPGTEFSWERAVNKTSVYPVQNKITHVLIDYSDFVALNDQGTVQKLQLFENALVPNTSKLVYNENLIKVYQLG